MVPIKVNTHCFGICGSIAVNVYLAGKVRSSDPLSRFTLHASSYSSEAKEGQPADNNVLLSQPFETYLEWDQERLRNYFGSTEEKAFNPQYAVTLGIVHEIKSYSLDWEEEITNVAIPN